MKKVTITVTGDVMDDSDLNPENYKVKVTSTEDCFFDVLNAKVTEMRTRDDVPDMRDPAASG
jgi:hypothetical protein